MFFPLLIILIAFDQLSKYLAIVLLKDQSYQLYFEKINLIYSENFGIAFGFKIPQIILVPLIIVFLYFFYTYCKKELPKSLKSTVLISLVLAGGIGNLIDRFAHGFVVDFISIYNYPVFNIADVYIAVGVLMLLIDQIKREKLLSKKTGH